MEYCNNYEVNRENSKVVVREALQVIIRMTTTKFSDNLANRFDYCDNLRIFNAVLA